MMKIAKIDNVEIQKTSGL